MIRLRKYYDTTRNTVYESQLSEDMNSIEKEINNLDGDLRNHKSDFQAHTSDQITHQGFSLRTYIESLYNR
ncbi:hypothetical protein MOB45_19770, partial [Bacillus inaquosorum]|nr:hypothetical protein [Bacillus inaquosorum]